MKKILIILIFILMGGCFPEGGIGPKLVCEKDGIKLYRVYDMDLNQWIYFTNHSAEWEVIEGKICNKSYHVE